MIRRIYAVKARYVFRHIHDYRGVYIKGDWTSILWLQWKSHRPLSCFYTRSSWKVSFHHPYISTIVFDF